MKPNYHLLTLLLFISIVQTAKSQSIQAYTHADTSRGSLTPLRSCYDVTFYHLDVQFNIDKKSISGSNEFRFTAMQDFSRLQFDLYANLQIDKIIYQNSSLSYTREANAVFVTFPKTISKGSKDQFTVYYSGQPTETKKAPRFGGIVFSTDSAGKPLVATACEGSGASIWWPNKDHLSDEADSMMISISVPRGLKDVSNGRLRRVTELKNGYTRFDWFVSNPINNYNVAANIGGYKHFSDNYTGENGKLSLDYWVLPEHLKKAKTQFSKSVKPVLAAYEYWFGPYPFYKDGYKLIETPYPAMEHQSAISYGGYLKGGPGNEMTLVQGKPGWDFIITHESAHEWFGNNMTAKDLADLWIHEAFGSYAESLFTESLYGKQAGQDYVFRSRTGISNDSPIIADYNVNQMGSGDMYSKGSTLLNMIRTIINDDEKWRNILRGLNKEFYHQTISYDQIVNYISQQSGYNLLPVFDQYLKYTALPLLEFAIINGEINSRWIANVNGFNMPVRVKAGKGSFQLIHPSTKFSPVNISGATIDNLKPDFFNFYIGMLKN